MLECNYPVIEMLQHVKMHSFIINKIYFVHYESYSEESNDFFEVFSQVEFILNGQPIQKVMVILTLILP